MSPERDQVFSGSITGAEERAGVTTVVHIQNSINHLLSRVPAVNIDLIGSAFYQRRPVCTCECIAVSSQGIGCFCQVFQIIPELFSPAPGSEHIKFGAVAIEEGNGDLTMEDIFPDVSHPEDGEIRSDQLVQVQFRTEEQCVMDPCCHYSRHILYYGHPLRIQNYSAANCISCPLQFCRGASLCVEHDAVGFSFGNYLCHSAQVIFRTCALIPRVIGNKEPASVRPGLAAHLSEAGGSSGQIAVEIPLVAVVEAQARPGGPEAVNVNMAEEPVVLVKVLCESLVSGEAILIFPVPRHLENHQVACAYPPQIFALVESLVKPYQVIEPSLCEHELHSLLPIAPEDVSIYMIGY